MTASVARVLLVVGGLAPGVQAQQVLEIDYSAGRVIIDDQWRAMRPTDLAIDRDRGVLYVIDREEPEGVMAFSFETGEWLRTLQAPTGEGPYEFPQGIKGMAVTPTGHLYVSGIQRVLEYDPGGTPVATWRPQGPMTRRVCVFGDEPGVPLQDGVLRRADGGDEAIGPNAKRQIQATSEEDGVTSTRGLLTASILCAEDRAYVFVPQGSGGRPDAVTVYHLNGELGTLALPTEYTDHPDDCRIEMRALGGQVMGYRPCPVWSQNLHPSWDGQGNVAVFGSDKQTAGAIINPETGCYALIRKNYPDDFAKVPAQMVGDSVVVFEVHTEMQADGTPLRHVNNSHKVSIHPLRRVSGEPCDGMLPGVK